MCFVSSFFFLFTLALLFHLSKGETPPLSLLLPLFLEAHYSRTESRAVFQHSEIITRPATALVSSLVNLREWARGEAIGAGVSNEDVHSLFIHHIFREINLHRVSVTAPSTTAGI